MSTKSADETPPVPTAAEMDEKLRQARAKFAGLGTADRKKAEQDLKKTRVDRRSLNASGRTALWGFRCRPGLKGECEALAKERGLLISEWLEEALEAAIAHHPKTKTRNGADHA